MKRLFFIFALTMGTCYAADEPQNPVDVTSELLNNQIETMQAEERLKNYSGFLDQMHRECLKQPADSAAELTNTCNDMVREMRQFRAVTAGELFYLFMLASTPKTDDFDPAKAAFETILNMQKVAPPRR